MLSENQFEIVHLLLNNADMTTDAIAQKLEYEIADVKKEMDLLEKNNLIVNGKVTDHGISELDYYKVDNAVIMAAGLSSRFAPLSYEAPKGLLKVKGEVLIERQINQLHEAGIKDIVVVVGYMQEKFFYLEEKYGVKILVNEDYFRRNNNSTLFVAKDYIKNTYICSSDNYFSVNVFRSHVYQSYYSAVYEEGKTNEYCMQLEENGRIKNITFGGQDSWVMLGHVYFSKAFSEKFLDILVREYNEPFVDGMLWEDLYIKHIDELDLYIKKYDKSEVFEFDTLDDLRLFDKNYINNTNSKIMKNICKVLSCKEEDITNIETIKKGLTNNSFIFQCKDKKYVYRYPGTGTEEIINRQSEAVSQNLAKKLQLDDTLIYISAEEGWKISHFIENCVDFDYHNEEHLKKGLKLVKTLHDANEKSHWDFNIFDEAQKLEDLTVKSGRNDFTDFKELKDKISKLYQLVEADGIEKRICHNDCYDPNFLTNGEVMYLIDWEYSGNSDPASDLGTFICCSDYTVEEAIDVLKIYFGREMTDIEKRHYLGYVAISSYYWFVWAIYKESVGDNIGEYTYLWYKYARTYGKIALELYGN